MLKIDGSLGTGQERRSAEVRLEIVRALAERERHSILANLIGWAGCVLAALALPNTSALALPLA